MSDDNKIIISKTVNFSKDNSIIEVAAKQSQTQTKNIVPPVMPKETKKE